jgi:hypothetical protein
VSRDEIDAWVAAALALVPKGDLCQSKFRSNLNIDLRNALGRKSEYPAWAVADVVRAAEQGIGCRPRYDSALLSLEWPASRAAR